MIASNQTRQTIIANNIIETKSFFARMKGLLGKRTLEESSGLLIPGCQAIHMVFMRFAIDVIFLSKEAKVVGLVKNIKPFFLSPFFFKAFYALELPVKTIEKSQTQIGDKVLFEERQD